MNYVDIALWVSAISLWLYVVCKIISAAAEWFDGIKKTKSDIKYTDEKINKEVKYLENRFRDHWEYYSNLKTRVEALEKKKK